VDSPLKYLGCDKDVDNKAGVSPFSGGGAVPVARDQGPDFRTRGGNDRREKAGTRGEGGGNVLNVVAGTCRYGFSFLNILTHHIIHFSQPPWDRSSFFRFFLVSFFFRILHSCTADWFIGFD
jgi:hypothetical protein